MTGKSIEVEKKFLVDDEIAKKLVIGASFVNEKVFTDTYFDTDDYKLSLQDRWLRLRGDKFQLKLPLNNGLSPENRQIDQYEELEDEETIRQALDIKKDGTFEEDLSREGIKPFCTFTTTRRKYKLGDFTIDLDDMDFGYKIGEIELMVKDKSEMPQALKRILDFAKEKSLVIAPVRGKVR